jgi:hypothetical protein
MSVDGLACQPQKGLAELSEGSRTVRRPASPIGSEMRCHPLGPMDLVFACSPDDIAEDFPCAADTILQVILKLPQEVTSIGV